MDKNKYRKSWLRAHKSYERKAYTILRKYFRSEANKIAYDFLDKDNYMQTIDNSVNIGGLYTAYFEMYKIIGVIHGERIGKGINRDIKDFNLITFQSEYQRGLFQWLIDNIGFRIVSVRQEYVNFIQQLVLQAFNDGFTTRELSDKIHKLINQRGFYRWQALRIARTESSAAANRAAMTAGRSSGIVLDKIWISIPDARTRTNPPSKFDHRLMDGVKVGENEYFDVNGEKILYPSAVTTQSGSQSSGGNVINCRCTSAYIPRRDSNGRIIRR